MISPPRPASRTPVFRLLTSAPPAAGERGLSGTREVPSVATRCRLAEGLSQPRRLLGTGRGVRVDGTEAGGILPFRPATLEAPHWRGNRHPRTATKFSPDAAPGRPADLPFGWGQLTKGVVVADYDIHINGGTIVDGTRVPRYQGDVWIKDGKIAQIGGRAQGVAERVIDADGQDRRPRLRRPAHPLRRPDPLGPVVHDLRLARRHVGGARQLRLRLRPVQARLPRPLDADDDAHRGHPVRVDGPGHAVGLGDDPGVPRLARPRARRASTSSSTCRRRR